MFLPLDKGKWPRDSGDEGVKTISDYLKPLLVSDFLAIMALQRDRFL